MDYEFDSLIFSVAFNPEAEFFNDLINIESHNGFSDFNKKNKKLKFELYVDGKKKSNWKIIGIRETYGSAWALGMSYLKFHFKENPEVLEILDAVLKKKNPKKIPIPND